MALFCGNGRLLISLLTSGHWAPEAIILGSSWAPKCQRSLTLFPWSEQCDLGMWATSPFGQEVAICTHICSPSQRKALTSEGQNGISMLVAMVFLAGKGLERGSLWGGYLSSDIISPCESHLLWFPGPGAVHLSKGCDGTPHLARATWGWGICITRSPPWGLFAPDSWPKLPTSEPPALSSLIQPELKPLEARAYGNSKITIKIFSLSKAGSQWTPFSYFSESCWRIIWGKRVHQST